MSEIDSMDMFCCNAIYGRFFTKCDICDIPFPVLPMKLDEMLNALKERNNQKQLKFNELAKIIEQETGMHSTLEPTNNHWAMKKIIAMGIPACQFIVDYWVENPNIGPHFFYALEKITGLTPIFPKQFDGVILMLEGAWASLLLEKGLIKEKEAIFNRNGTWSVK